jgi:glutamate-1-semialdehyde 2,1-aminomutase
MGTRTRSQEYFQALSEVIPGGVSSPVRAFSGLDMVPLVIDSGHKDTLVDVDGNEYIDYCNSWGALIHGHAHPAIVEAAKKRIEQGSSFGLATYLEDRLARKIISFMPFIQKIRFVSTGTEATMSACRLARAYTGKSTIVKFDGCYHGHSDGLLVRGGSGTLGKASSPGVPEGISGHTVSLPYNDSAAFDRFLNDSGKACDIACVIIEPIATNMGLISADKSFLATLRARTKEISAVLIFDEVVTGFRIGKAGASGFFGIEPDLVTLGKIIGGGFPAAAFGGKASIMDLLAPGGGVYQAGTLSGNPVAMEAGWQALTLLDEPGFYEILDEKARIIADPVCQFLKTHAISATLSRMGSCMTLFFGIEQARNMRDVLSCNRAQFNSFFSYLFDRGIFIPPSQQEIMNLSRAHEIGNLETTRDIILEYLRLCT